MKINIRSKIMSKKNQRIISPNAKRDPGTMTSLLWYLPKSRLAYTAVVAYCRSRYLLRNVASPAITDEKQHWARTRIRKRGLSKRSTNFLGKPDQTQMQITSDTDFYSGTIYLFFVTKIHKAIKLTDLCSWNVTNSLFRKPSKESSSSEPDSLRVTWKVSSSIQPSTIICTIPSDESMARTSGGM